MERSELSKEELARYARHLTLPEVGVEGQQRLKRASILLVGTGGLGAPVGLYLAAAGIGRLGLVDFDAVEASNLQRQIIHGQSDVGRPKVRSAAEAIGNVNPMVKVDLYDERFTSANAMEIAKDYDLIIDGTDNFPTRYLVNDVCVLLDKPNCYGSIFQFEGQASVFHYDGGPCYRCLYPKPPAPGTVPSCAEAGVLGVLPGVIGMIQATEAIKIALGQGTSLSGRLLLYDALEMTFRQLSVGRDPGCPVCGDQPTITAPIDYQQFCSVGAPKEKPMKEVSCQELKQRLDDDPNSFTLLDVRKDHEFETCNLGGKLIPLDELPDRMGELDSAAEIIVHCKMGGRSARAVQFLSENGFQNVANLTGGILQWIDEIDPSLTKY